MGGYYIKLFDYLVLESPPAVQCYIATCGTPVAPASVHTGLVLGASSATWADRVLSELQWTSQLVGLVPSVGVDAHFVSAEFVSNVHYLINFHTSPNEPRPSRGSMRRECFHRGFPEFLLGILPRAWTTTSSSLLASGRWCRGCRHSAVTHNLPLKLARSSEFEDTLFKAHCCIWSPMHRHTPPIVRPDGSGGDVSTAPEGHAWRHRCVKTCDARIVMVAVPTAWSFELFASVAAPLPQLMYGPLVSHTNFRSQQYLVRLLAVGPDQDEDDLDLNLVISFFAFCCRLDYLIARRSHACLADVAFGLDRIDYFTTSHTTSVQHTTGYEHHNDKTLQTTAHAVVSTTILRPLRSDCAALCGVHRRVANIIGTSCVFGTSCRTCCFVGICLHHFAVGSDEPIGGTTTTGLSLMLLGLFSSFCHEAQTQHSTESAIELPRIQCPRLHGVSWAHNMAADSTGGGTGSTAVVSLSSAASGVFAVVAIRTSTTSLLCWVVVTWDIELRIVPV